MKSRIPLPPLVLGLAGLLPAIGGAFAAFTDWRDFGSVAAGTVLMYCALILSFLGGTWWAFAAREERPRWWLMALAVVPTLAVWLILPMTASFTAGMAVAAMVLVSPVVDAILQARGLTPPWWLRLRIILSVGLAASLAFALWWTG